MFVIKKMLLYFQSDGKYLFCDSNRKIDVIGKKGEAIHLFSANQLQMNKQTNKQPQNLGLGNEARLG